MGATTADDAATADRGRPAGMVERWPLRCEPTTDLEFASRVCSYRLDVYARGDLLTQRSVYS